MVSSPCNPDDGFENYLFYKIIKNESLSYLHHRNPKPLTSYYTRNIKNLPPIKASHSFFKITLFLSTITELNNLDSNIRCSPSFQLFRKRILEFIRPSSIFNIPNSLGLTYLTKLRVGLSRLRKHKFRHNFRDSLNPICNYGNAIEQLSTTFSTARISRIKASPPAKC